MIVFPNCKINLGLNITAKRPDGFHDLETLYYPLPFFEALEGVVSDEYIFTMSGIPVPGDVKENICTHAYNLVKKDYPGIPDMRFHLHKAIPAGAGLGGGSADGAFTLLLLNNKFNLGISTHELTEYAARLGSDCPFFIYNKPCLGKGRGDVLETVGLDLSDFRFLLVHPGIHINTGWAFSQLNYKSGKPKESILDIIRSPVKEWKNRLCNDFEIPVFEKYPEIARIKETMYQAGALYASLTGSGSAVYGIFREINLREGMFPGGYLVKAL